MNLLDTLLKIVDFVDELLVAAHDNDEKEDEKEECPHYNKSGIFVIHIVRSFSICE